MWIRLLSERDGRKVGDVFETDKAVGKGLVSAGIAEAEKAPARPRAEPEPEPEPEPEAATVDEGGKA